MTLKMIILKRTVVFLTVITLITSCDYDDSTALNTIDTTSNNGQVTAFLTTPDQNSLVQELPDKFEFSTEVRSDLVITIDENDIRQEVEGFGAALTGSSAFLLNNNQEALNTLFAQDQLNLSYLRLTVGSSDFTKIGNYSYNETGGAPDPTLSLFSLEQDMIDDNPIIPVAQQILGIDSEIKFMSSPWSAPAWMKSNNSLENGFLLASNYSVYARYWEMYLEGYKNAGIEIDAITPQNEPLFATDDYPTMFMSAQMQATFIGQHLGPRLAANTSISPKIISYDHNFFVGEDPDYPTTVLSNPLAAQYTNAVAYHAYGGQPSDIDAFRDVYPDAEIYFTEQSGIRTGNTTFGGELNFFLKNVFIGTLRRGAKAILLWNLALDENSGPTNGGCDICTGVIEVSSSGAIRKNPEFYILSHFSKFVQPGAVVINSTQVEGQLLNVAFKNPDGSKVLVLYNDSGLSGQDIRVDIEMNGQRFNYAVPNGSLTTFTWD
ncbi:glycoside hydrolase family 30 protein [Nonlabens agnitus]|nr:glycoside hydrolase family 30 beta sandwich domain-containing protein [Nonlabens agnitus]